MNRLIFFTVALSDFVFALSSFAIAPKIEEECIGKQHCRANIRHIEKGGIGYEDGYTRLEIFLA